MTEVAPLRLLTQTEALFDARRRALVWQAIKPDRFPQAIWPVHSEADIVEALAYARAKGLRVSIVSGGHSYIGHGIRDGTLVLDLSRLNGMAIDVDGKSGWIEPGVRVAAFDAVLAAAGLAFPIGHDPNVGLVGYLLGGGMGWNADSWNSMACFNITAADIILASGERLTADADHHQDLFWAVRGAGANFCGIVSRFHVRLFARPEAICRSDYLFSFDARLEVLAWLERMHASLDRRTELSLTFTTDPERDGAGRPQRRCSVSLVVFADTATAAAALCEPLCRTLPSRGLLSRSEAVPTTFAALLDAAKGDAALRRTVESIWTDDPYPAAQAAAEAFLMAPSADSVIYIGLRKGDGLPIDAACSMLGKGFIFVDAAWRAEQDDRANDQWVDHVTATLAAHDKGAYINETNWDRRPERVARCYSPAALRRLSEINDCHDPSGLFVKPAM